MALKIIIAVAVKRIAYILNECFSKSLGAKIEKKKAKIIENGVFIIKEVIPTFTPKATFAENSVIVEKTPIAPIGKT
jgi:hypothetical protein